MASRVVVTTQCDAPECEKEDAQAFAFAFGGASYTVDLCADHHAEHVSPFTRLAAIARPAPRARTRSGGPAGPERPRRPGTEDTAALRAWARVNGWPDLGTRGRIPAEVKTAWLSRAAA